MSIEEKETRQILTRCEGKIERIRFTVDDDKTMAAVLAVVEDIEALGHEVL